MQSNFLFISRQFEAQIVHFLREDRHFPIFLDYAICLLLLLLLLVICLFADYERVPMRVVMSVLKGAGNVMIQKFELPKGSARS